MGAVLVGGLWIFPRVWYRTQAVAGNFIWLGESTNITGWAYEPMQISRTEEIMLDANRTFSARFTRGKEEVTAFSAKRYSENPNEIGLFVHTPDRCWVEAGWKLQPVTPDLVEVEIGGIRASAERRIFTWRSGERQLVYFIGLAGGQPVPYRLDHNVSVSLRRQMQKSSEAVGGKMRASDGKFWGRIWECFTERRPMLGPKQFLRVATPIYGSDISGADARLKELLAAWLKPVEFEAEAKLMAQKP